MISLIDRLKGNQTIPLSKHSAFHQSVSRIEWFEAKIGHYGLNIVSTCSRPYYMARLTGSSLVATQRMMHYNLLEGEPHKVKDAIYRERGNSMQYLGSTPSPTIANQATGTLLSVLEFFPIHHAGIYNLEILHISCNSTDKSLVTDCLPNSLGLITLNEAFSIELGASNNNVSSRIGWVRQKSNLTLDESITTRMQIGNTSECDTCSNSWFDKYNITLPDLVQNPDGTNCTICLVGASHSRHMAQAMNTAFQMKQPSCRAIHFDIKFPQDFVNPNFNVNGNITKHKCTDVIVAMGQWALSWKNGDQFQSQHDFKRHMTNVVDSFLADHPDKRLTLRSLHYHPLSKIILDCKPTDWRSPMLTDTYNDMLMQIAESHPAFHMGSKLCFVDTSEVVRPVWDTPDDWSHYGMKAGVPEAIFLLNQIWTPNEEVNVKIYLIDDVLCGHAPCSQLMSAIGILLFLIFLVVRKNSRRKQHFGSYMRLFQSTYDM